MKFRIQQLHRISGLVLAVFIGFHLLNQLSSIISVNTHLWIMDLFRKVYRNIFIETILLLAVFLQVISGIRLLWGKRRKKLSLPEKMQVYSGIYLSFFLLAHVYAVLDARYNAEINTNFYFAAAGLNMFPQMLFFFPYYFLAVNAVTIHIASVHYIKSKHKTRARGISAIIILSGIVAAFIIFYGFTDGFTFREIPKEYTRYIE